MRRTCASCRPGCWRRRQQRGQSWRRSTCSSRGLCLRLRLRSRSWRPSRLAKERDLQAAMLQLDRLEKERSGALEQYKEVSRKLERATNKTKNWKDKVAKHEGLVRLIQPGHKGPQRITNWGPASFTDTELELRKKSWQESKNQGAQAQ
ncbi:Switch-associated protein 70 [Larimichthys crocea]|uniref:Uncharacterized protein n=1 Tax=Larimichthys crocea TaxID=215358 RepID=A0ACD3R0D9_LARCR|nr:Switch-associated protein 70 [Larimichthys crocea]